MVVVDEAVVVVVVEGVVVDVVVVVVVGTGVPDAAIAGVWFEVATDVPFLLLAVTVTRNVEPRSPAAARYVCAVAVVMSAHGVPASAQRIH